VRFLDRSRSRIPRPWRTIIDWSLTIAVAVGFVLAFEAEVAKPYRIPSSSMERTLHCARPGPWCQASVDDRVIANRLAYRFRSPRRGEIVVFNPPAAAARCAGSADGPFVKRLIGLPGEHVAERNGIILIDGRPIHEPYVDPRFRDHDTGSWPRIGANSYFVLGDDRAHSCDSRTWGTVSRNSLIGPVIVTYWPLNRIAFH
jgi:signal peptidase I